MSLQNVEDHGWCTDCGRKMPLKQLFKHRLKNGDCPDARGLFALTAKGKRISAKRRRH